MTIAVTDANLVYSPGNWVVSSGSAKTVNTGAYLRFACASTASIVLNFNTTGNTGTAPVIKWRIDGSGWTRVPIAATVTIPLPTDNTWTRHEVEIVYASLDEYVHNWGTQAQHVTLTSIDGPTASRPLQARPLRLAWIGDSISSGHLAAKYDLGVAGGDAAVTFPYLTTRLLNAEGYINAHGGMGWGATSPAGFPAVLSSWRYLWSGQAVNWSTVNPDALIINLGENDGGSVTSAVTAWLTDALSVLPSKTKIIVMRPYSGKVDTQPAVTALGNPRVTWLDTTGWWDTADATHPIHPTGYASIVDFAPRLAAEIEDVLGVAGTAPTPRSYINVGGVAVPASY